MKTMCSPDDINSNLARCDGKDERTACGKSKCRFVASAELVAEHFVSLQCVQIGAKFSGREGNMSTAGAKSSGKAKPSDQVIDAPFVASRATRSLSAQFIEEQVLTMCAKRSPATCVHVSWEISAS